MAIVLNPFMTSILLLSVLLVHQTRSQCSANVTEEELDVIVTKAVIDSTSEGGGDVLVDIHEWNVNCLAAAPMGGYRTATITVNYTSSGTAVGGNQPPEVAQIVLFCNTFSDPLEAWVSFSGELITSANTEFFAGGGMATIDELFDAEADRNCLHCNALLAKNSSSFCLRECVHAGDTVLEITCICIIIINIILDVQAYI